MLSPVGFRPHMGAPVRFGKLDSAQENLAKALGADPDKIADADGLKKTFLDKVADSFKNFKFTDKYKSPSDFLDLSRVIEVYEHVLKTVLLPLGEKMGKFNVKFKDTDSIETFKDTLSKEDQIKVFEFIDKDLPKAMGLSDGEQLTNAVMDTVEPIMAKLEEDN